MGRLEQRKRNTNRRERKPLVAIGCEGKNQTETIYFKNFSSRRCNVKFSTGRHTDPVGMANDLVDFMQREDIKAEYGDKIYLLIDTDVNKEEQFQIDEAKKICHKHGIELIVSVPTFEYWYILHFGYTTRIYQSSEQVKNEMKKQIEGYSESMNVYPIIKHRTEEAIKNAKKVENFQITNGQKLDNEKCNPYTGIYKVVEELQRRK